MHEVHRDARAVLRGEPLLPDFEGFLFERHLAGEPEPLLAIPGAIGPRLARRREGLVGQKPLVLVPLPEDPAGHRARQRDLAQPLAVEPEHLDLQPDVVEVGHEDAPADDGEVADRVRPLRHDLAPLFPRGGFEVDEEHAPARRLPGRLDREEVRPGHPGAELVGEAEGQRPQRDFLFEVGDEDLRLRPTFLGVHDQPAPVGGDVGGNEDTGLQSLPEDFLVAGGIGAQAVEEDAGPFAPGSPRVVEAGAVRQDRDALVERLRQPVGQVLPRVHVLEPHLHLVLPGLAEEVRRELPVPGDVRENRVGGAVGGKRRRIEKHFLRSVEAFRTQITGRSASARVRV